MSNKPDDRQYWKMRATGYEQLEWAKQGSYLDAFLHAGGFCQDDVVLDVGTGTGIIAHALAPAVKRVVGLDSSVDMLEQARATQMPNEEFLEGDIRETDFPEGSFNKITARMVFHHIMTDIDLAVANCHRFLRPGGRLILSEGVPPHPDVKDWYTEMFKLKEERRTFLEQDLVDLVRAGGFKEPQIVTYTASQMSIRNWLQKSGLTQDIQDRIYQMHLELDGLGKHYRMKVTDEDIFLDWKFVILSADR